MTTMHGPRNGLPSATERRLLELVEGDFGEMLALSRWMASHPELSLEEHATSERYRAYLSARGFAVTPVGPSLPTAFIASRGAEDAAVRVGLLAEMDALPEIGHACGHNLSGPASLLAAHAAAGALPPDAARIVVIGCPAEETGVGKRRLVELGAFEGLDAAMMAHASDMRRAHRLFLGNAKREIVFHGRASHAAAYPEEGINALDGVIAFFVALGLLRQQLPREVRVHGIVSDGGQAPNVIPERAAARVWVRSLEERLIEATSERVLACARGAAEATGTRLEVLEELGGSPPMHPNLSLARCYGRQLRRLGLEETAHGPGDAIGSSDITHVSRVVPTIHPNFPIGEHLQLHTRAFAAATTTGQGESGLLEAARALALTVAELAHDPELRSEVKRDAPKCVQ
jgi:amidohydrolase